MISFKQQTAGIDQQTLGGYLNGNSGSSSSSGGLAALRGFPQPLLQKTNRKYPQRSSREGAEEDLTRTDSDGKDQRTGLWTSKRNNVKYAKGYSKRAED